MITPIRKLILAGLPRSLALRSALYVRNSWTYRDQFGDSPNLAELVRRFGPWQRSIRDRLSPMMEANPWLTYGAIEFLEKNLKAGMSVFEYGSGGSTLFFARRQLSGTSVEHDADWAQQVRTALPAIGDIQWDVRCVPPEPGLLASSDPSEPGAYFSSDPAFVDVNFRAYASAIDSCADWSLDLVSIDGRARPSCVAHAIPKVKPGGYLLLDQAERESYKRAIRLITQRGWQHFAFPGPVPYTLVFSQTAIWQRPHRDKASA